MSNDFIYLLPPPFKNKVRTSKRYNAINIKDETISHYKSMKVMSEQLNLPYSSLVSNFRKSSEFIMGDYQIQKVDVIETEFITPTNTEHTENIYKSTVVDSSHNSSPKVTNKNKPVSSKPIMTERITKQDVEGLNNMSSDRPISDQNFGSTGYKS
jgi:hypothetical protein